MRRMPFYLLALMAAIGWCTVVRAAPGDDSGGFTIAPDKDEPLKIEGEDVVPGDGSRFHIRTDDNIEKLKEDDVYSSGLNTMFKVVAIVEKGTTGGSFTVSRLRGNSNPDRKFNRISGNGPLTIVVTQTLLDLYKAGGPFLHPLAVLGVCTILLSLNCLWIYRRRRQCSAQFVREARAALEKGDINDFGKLAMKSPGLFPYVCRAMSDRWETSTTKDIESRCQTAASAQINRLRVPVRALNLIAAAAPLLGLLGTIVGMVIVFEAVASATGAAKAQALAAGIRVKLFSTAMALIVAIPSLFLFWIFNQKLNGLIAECELLAEEFVHEIRILKRRKRRASAAASEADDGDGDDTDGTPIRKPQTASHKPQVSTEAAP